MKNEATEREEEVTPQHLPCRAPTCKISTPHGRIVIRGQVPPPRLNIASGSRLPRRSTGGHASCVDNDDDIASPPHAAKLIGALVMYRARSVTHGNDVPPQPIDYSSGQSKKIKEERYTNAKRFDPELFVEDDRFYNLFTLITTTRSFSIQRR